jgi:hypothetical protein
MGEIVTQEENEDILGFCPSVERTWVRLNRSALWSKNGDFL